MNVQKSEKFIATHHSIHLLSHSLTLSLMFNINIIIFLFCCRFIASPIDCSSVHAIDIGDRLQLQVCECVCGYFVWIDDAATATVCTHW